jgi:TonB family protein
MNLKIKIMKRLPDVTDEEIRSHMNFDKVLQQRNTIVKTGNFLKACLAVSGVAVISVLSYVYTSNKTSGTQSVVNPAAIEKEVEAPALPQQDRATNQKADDVSERRTKQHVEEKKAPKTEIQSKKQNTEVPQVPESLYIQAEPVSGYDALFAYFRSNLSYPKEAIADSIQGVLTVSFVINKEGKPQNIEFQKSLGEPFEKEVLKLIQQMPPWKPASLNGKPVNSKISLPLTFELMKK